MKRLAIFSVFTIALPGLMALYGRYVAHNSYLDHTLSAKVSKFIEDTGRWPRSWDDLETEGISPFPKHKSRCDIAWHVDPFELYERGMVMPSRTLEEGECPVVYYKDHMPDSQETIWLLPISIAQAIESRSRKNRH